MLRYLANGRIQWSPRMPCNTRTNWEFYAVIDGQCGPVFRKGGRPVLLERTLWLFAPECSHAWADDGHPFHRIALHFGSVPYPLDEIVRERGWFAKKLTTDDIERLKQIAVELEPHFVNPNILSPLHFQGRLMDLAVMLLQDHPRAQPPALPDVANFKVERALSWFSEHMHRNPSIREVADAIHVSVSHLRRLFWQVRKASPRSIFQRARLERVNELMGRSSLTLEAVAAQCGYTDASHLCREYKRIHHFTPTHWRKRLIASIDEPVPDDVVPVRQFSARPADRTMSA